MKIFSHIALSFLLLLASSGVTINMHFCKGHLYDIALNIPAHNCCANDDDDCHHDQDFTNTHHCDDKTIKVKPTDSFLVCAFYPDLKYYNSDNDFTEAQILFENSGTSANTPARLFYYKKPPPAREVVLSRIQAFLL